MSDKEVENKKAEAENQGEVSAPTEIGEPTEGAKKDIRWYVIHTYSGYENKVKDTLTRKVHSMGMDDTIREILLPLEEAEEEKDGKVKLVSRKIFPGYLLIKMEVNNRSWYVVRNTPGVTGFVGTTTKPIPLSDEEAERIINGGVKTANAETDVKPGDRIRITKGVFEDRTAVVLEVSDDKTKIKADISNFGTTTTIELEAGSFEPLP
ncbi:transcription termination/antitermination protein NusG [uncultured Dialister sp.]|jgi:transcriptional antiterminator NusG|uniref:transcription termination/antitermination protein NusG n=1 Tax=uncultured Dialister sp. TaxID=278064 RepID=UPI002602F5C5|nr:transcription termination/antitermination protein NusG [uncultured Dialister sp.]